MTAIDRRTFLGAVAGLAIGGSGSGAARGRLGVNVCGAEFGDSPQFCNENPGEFGRAFTYNSERTVAYFANQGLGLVRMPFRWERIQPRLGMPLDPAELDRLKQFLAWAKEHKARVIPDVHNYGRYRIRAGGRVIDARIDQKIDGEPLVSREHFADLWRRLSSALERHPAVHAYGLMNEPHDMADSDWKGISQAAVDAVRGRGDETPIMVAGESYSNSERFARVNGPRAWIKDPAGRTIYEAHCYFDQDFSGRYAKSHDAELAADPRLKTRGLRRVRPFLEWCAANKVKGFVGEFGVPGSDPRWLELLPPFLDALETAGVDACWWAAGEWWGLYPLSIQPLQNYQRPAPPMKALAGRLKK